MLLRCNELFEVSTILYTEHHNIYAVSYLTIIPIANLAFARIEPFTNRNPNVSQQAWCSKGFRFSDLLPDHLLPRVQLPQIVHN